MSLLVSEICHEKTAYTTARTQAGTFMRNHAHARRHTHTRAHTSGKHKIDKHTCVQHVITRKRTRVVRTSTCTRTCTHTYTHTYTHTHTRAHTHTHTHTHTAKDRSVYYKTNLQGRYVINGLEQTCEPINKSMFEVRWSRLLVVWLILVLEDPIKEQWLL